jgi:CTP synthase
MEVIELSREAHPFFVGCQYHPELKSRVPVEGGAAGAGKASPPFIGLMMAASDQLEAHLASLSNRR